LHRCSPKKTLQVLEFVKIFFWVLKNILFFDKYGVDLVFTSDNHNYQRTFPIKFNDEKRDSSNNPIIVDSNQNNYHININDDNNNNNNGVIYIITGTGGRSLYDIEEEASFVANQDDQHFGFLNINIDDKTLKGTFFANEKGSESEFPRYHYVTYSDNIVVDQFTISKVDKPNNNNNKFDKFVGLPR